MSAGSASKRTVTWGVTSTWRTGPAARLTVAGGMATTTRSAAAGKLQRAGTAAGPESCTWACPLRATASPTILKLSASAESWASRSASLITATMISGSATATFGKCSAARSTATATFGSPGSTNSRLRFGVPVRSNHATVRLLTAKSVAAPPTAKPSRGAALPPVTRNVTP